MTDEKRAELLMDHYKDTFRILQYHWKARNRLFMYILILIAVIALDSITIKSVEPKVVPASEDTHKDQQRLLSSLINGFVKARLKTGDKEFDPIDFPIIDMMARFLLLCLVIQYYQRSVFVDREYKYLNDLETNVCCLLGGDYVTREGKAYFSRTGVSVEGQKSERPLFLRWAGILYLYVFPALLFILLSWKFLEQDLRSESLLVGIAGVILSMLIAFSNGLYLYWQLHERRTVKRKQVNVPKPRKNDSLY